MSCWNEIRRRNVYRVGTACAVVAWFLPPLLERENIQRPTPLEIPFCCRAS